MGKPIRFLFFWSLCVLFVFSKNIGSVSETNTHPRNSKEIENQSAEINADVSSLRLIPFPKIVQMTGSAFNLKQSLIIETGAGNGSVLGNLITEELMRAGFKQPQCNLIEGAGPVLYLYAEETSEIPLPAFQDTITEQGYLLSVDPHRVIIQSPGEEGLVYGVQTLCQLIRANRIGDAISGLRIEDWPSIQWRAFQDDLTRGPSTRLDFLKRELALGSYLKMNIFTYYMEYQFAHAKHPLIGPADGSLTAEELRQLVEYGAPLHLNIMGNQQSFAHFEKILSHEEYAPLRENSYVITPAKEETYQFLDDLYAGQIPYLPFQFFNVCCDETSGIGEGPAKAMVETYGVAATYVKHILRIHDLIHNKYGKRMMMWGDIILNHPDHLKDIPKDIIMMTWGYDARDNFESQIVPFAQHGFDFFVCPGVSSWSVILPNFRQANVNIQNFVRDGHKHGCLGVLNTDWDDDGRTFNAVNVYEYAWGAECSWNASLTPWEDFNRRVGAVLFGEEQDDFGKAVQRLLPVGGKNNSLFFHIPLASNPNPSMEKSLKAFSSQMVDETLRPARTLLQSCQARAVVNADLLDYFIFGVDRLELIVRREENRREAAAAYEKAQRLPPEQTIPSLQTAITKLRQTRDAYAGSRDCFIELWNRENKPYALSWIIEGGHKVYNVSGSYNEVISAYDALIHRLEASTKTSAALPPAGEIGLGIETQSQ
ncbi:MAG: hypothetical protein C4527_02525 [Candidatus Omnitrophota bacterium]|jgi:hypothetical protein|nr:MAG: hypothetical protein C4527_02525 [Candidatus Omnitrophota bacterium]